MDNEYLENIIGSSYVDNGVEDRITIRQRSKSKLFFEEIDKEISHKNTKLEAFLPNFIQKLKSSASSPNNKEQASNNDFARIVERVIDIIIDTVKWDSDRAEIFLSDDPTKQRSLPTNWEQPSITKDVTEARTPDTDEGDEPNRKPSSQSNLVDKEKSDADDDEPEMPGEFLYNFHSKYDKQRNFSIEMEPSNNKLKLVNIENASTLKKIDVIWNNKQHENNIYVKHVNVRIEKIPDDKGTIQDVPTPLPGRIPENVLIFRFWDDQVNLRNPQSKNFNIGLLLK